MSYPRYQEYIKSGVEWLGETPSTWTIKRVGYFFNERREKVSDKDFQPLSVTKNGIVPQLESAAKSDDGDNRKKVCIGDFVINSRSDRKGSSGASALDGSVSLINTVIVPNENIDIKFAHNLFRSTAFQEEYYRYGKGIVADLWSTNYSEMKNISIPIPSLKEQRIIADFLENETSKIDYLVAEQEKLIELLKEKRQAIIFHAVTKGLDATVKMKDSGVVWLGNVPNHWEVKPLKHIVKLDGGAGFPNDEQGDEAGTINFFKVADLAGGLINSSSKISAETATKLRAKIFKVGTIAFAKVGAALLLNRRVIMTVDGCVDNNMMVAIPSNSVNVQWLMRLLSVVDFALLVNPGAVPSVNQEQVGNIKIPVPKLQEQNLISHYLEVEISKINTLESEINNGLALLKERRSGLISAAVTGQIDARNYQQKEIA
jgi:type I restriction enzyme S subunit